MEAVKSINPNHKIIALYGGTKWGGSFSGCPNSIASIFCSPVGLVERIVAQQTDFKMVNEEEGNPTLVLHHHDLPLMRVNCIGKLYVDRIAIKEFAIQTHLVSGEEHDIEHRVSYIYEILLDEIVGCLGVQVNVPGCMVTQLSVPGQWMQRNQSVHGLSLIKMNFVNRYDV